MRFFDLLFLVIPESIILVTALVVLAVDVMEMRLRPNRWRMLVAALLSIAGCSLSLYWLGQAEPTFTNRYLDGLLVVDPLVLLVKQGLLVLTIFTALISVGSEFTDHVGEFFALVLLATLGLMFLVSSENLLMVFVSLELLSLPLYIMTAFNRRSAHSAEAGLKYFLFGGMSAAFLLFGLSWLYGATGELNLVRIASALGADRPDPLVTTAVIMVVIGLGFKIAAVPFHLWAPDVYQGAPPPSAAFIAAGSKLGSFFILAKVMTAGFAASQGSAAWRSFAPGWLSMLALIAALSMVLGNLAALAQRSVRRLLAYSAVAQAGYILTGLLANSSPGMSALLYYAFTYALTIIGAFGVVAFVEQAQGGESLADFAGLSRRAPLLSFCMLVFLLSLAGIPPLAGFFGKFYLFTAAASGVKILGLLWVVILAVAMSAVSLYYYLQVLKQIYVAAPAGKMPALSCSPLARTAIALLAIAVVALGVMPSWLLDRLQPVLKAAGW